MRFLPYFNPVDEVGDYESRRKFRKLRKQQLIASTFVESMQEKSAIHILVFSLSTSLLYGSGVFFLFFLFNRFTLPDTSVFVWLFGLTFILFISFVVYLRTSYIKFIALSVAFILVGTAIFFMFHAEYYGKFLRFTGFGGGKQIVVYYNNHPKSISPEKIIGGLLIRTSTSLILFQDINNNVIELPIANVTKITYDLRYTTDIQLP